MMFLKTFIKNEQVAEQTGATPFVSLRRGKKGFASLSKEVEGIPPQGRINFLLATKEKQNAPPQARKLPSPD